MLSNRRSTMIIAPAVTQQLKADIAAAAEPRNAPSSILTATTSNLPGFRIKMIMGTVHGASVNQKPKNAKTDAPIFSRSNSNGVSHEVRHLTHALYEARNVAHERMELTAVSMGANAVIGVGYEQGELLGCVQCSVYGTAVFVERVTGEDEAGAVI